MNWTAWQNSRHFARSPLVSPQNDVWGTNAKFPADGASLPTFGLCLTLIGWSKFSTNQGHEFLRLFLRCHFARKPLVASRNVSCFLRLLSRDTASLSLWLYGCVIGWTFLLFLAKKWLDNNRGWTIRGFIIRKTYRSATADNPSNNNKETRTLPTQKFWQYLMFNV